MDAKLTLRDRCPLYRREYRCVCIAATLQYRHYGSNHCVVATAATQITAAANARYYRV